jgi:methionyl-tRNA formyltransferase
MTTTGKLKIVFMGTPDFAVASLDALVNAGFNVVGVITAPDKPAGRGLHPQQSAVKTYSLEKGLFILQPEKLKNPNFLQQLAGLQADIQVVVAFRMLPELVWNMPPMGTYNVHASLLPQYRGAAPINWAIINGEKQTGVTIFKLKHEIDTGDILLQKTVSIEDKDTAGTLHDKLKVEGAKLLTEAMRDLAMGSAKNIPQSALPVSDEELKHAPKIFTETCEIDWSKTGDEIYNLVRGLSPYPAAFTDLYGKKIKVYSVEKDFQTSARPGSIETDTKKYLKFACADCLLSIKELQMEGKKRMRIEEFLRGYKFPS